jgi:hypothetical protein
VTGAPWEAQLAAALSEAEAAYVQAAGGEAVCKLHKDGRVDGGLKYEEGRVIALRDLQRALRSAQDEPADGTSLTETARAEHARWQADLEIYQGQGRPLTWLAYAQGGVDALQPFTHP